MPRVATIWQTQLRMDGFRARALMVMVMVVVRIISPSPRMCAQRCGLCIVYVYYMARYNDDSNDATFMYNWFFVDVFMQLHTPVR